MTDQSWLLGDEGRTWMSYLRGSQLLDRAVDGDLRSGAGVSHPEFEILARLGAAPGHRLRMGELAERLLSPKSRLSYQIDRLVTRGLVLRVAHPGDRRGLDAVLTPAGLQLVEQAAAALVESVRRHLLGRLSSTQMKQLEQIMRRVADGLACPAGGS